MMVQKTKVILAIKHKYCEKTTASSREDLCMIRRIVMGKFLYSKSAQKLLQSQLIRIMKIQLHYKFHLLERQQKRTYLPLRLYEPSNVYIHERTVKLYNNCTQNSSRMKDEFRIIVLLLIPVCPSAPRPVVRTFPSLVRIKLVSSPQQI